MNQASRLVTSSPALEVAQIRISLSFASLRYFPLVTLKVTRILFLHTLPSLNHTQDHKNKGNHYKLKKLLIVKQTLLVSTLGGVQRTVWRIRIPMLGCKGLTKFHHNVPLKFKQQATLDLDPQRSIHDVSSIVP